MKVRPVENGKENVFGTNGTWSAVRGAGPADSASRAIGARRRRSERAWSSPCGVAVPSVGVSSFFIFILFLYGTGTLEPLRPANSVPPSGPGPSAPGS
jgi:hypothetical protein